MAQPPPARGRPRGEEEEEVTDSAYWESMVGQAPMKRWYKLMHRICLAYGLTEVVRIGGDVVLRPIGEPEALSEDGVTVQILSIPPPPKSTWEQRP
jgi:hypothetical protein